MAREKGRDLRLTRALWSRTVSGVPDLAVPFLAACLLLLAAGAGKLRSPAATAQALRTQRLPAAPGLVRLLGAAELLLAVAALAQVPGAALLVAGAYAGFTVFVVAVLLRGGPLSSCGCFGKPDLPATPTHLAVTAPAAVCAALVGGQAGLPALLAAPALTALPVAASAGLVAWLAFLVLTGLPRLAAARAALHPLPDRTSLRSATP